MSIQTTTDRDTSVLDLPAGARPDPEEFIAAAMRWHFDPATGSPFWVERAKSLDFDPRLDVRTHDDLRLFPNVTDELRDVPVRDLIPRGYGPRPRITAVVESGGTTGAPKRLPLLTDWADRMIANDVIGLEKRNVSREKDWVSIYPSGPHGSFEQAHRAANAWGVLLFGIDMDPRWVKKQLAAGNRQVVDDYTTHLVEQAAYIILGQNIGLIRLTAPVLARIVERDDLVTAIQEKVTHIQWGGASMDADSRYLYRTEIFPDVRISGAYGTTMALNSGCAERPDLSDDDPCIFDPNLSPWVTLGVVDPTTREPVAVGERGQLVVHHVSRSFLLPNNAERDFATREESPNDNQIGVSVSDIAPMPQFNGVAAIEGVY